MKGIVKMINPKRGMIAVEVDNNDLTVIEILEMSYSAELGDVISGKLNSLGGEKLVNLSKNEKMDIFIQGIECSPQSARDLMR